MRHVPCGHLYIRIMYPHTMPTCTYTKSTIGKKLSTCRWCNRLCDMYHVPCGMQQLGSTRDATLVSVQFTKHCNRRHLSGYTYICKHGGRQSNEQLSNSHEFKLSLYTGMSLQIHNTVNAIVVCACKNYWNPDLRVGHEASHIHKVLGMLNE